MREARNEPTSRVHGSIHPFPYTTTINNTNMLHLPLALAWTICTFAMTIFSLLIFREHIHNFLFRGVPLGDTPLHFLASDTSPTLAITLGYQCALVHLLVTPPAPAGVFFLVLGPALIGTYVFILPCSSPFLTIAKASGVASLSVAVAIRWIIGVALSWLELAIHLYLTRNLTAADDYFFVKIVSLLRVFFNLTLDWIAVASEAAYVGMKKFPRWNGLGPNQEHQTEQEVPPGTINHDESRYFLLPQYSVCHCHRLSSRFLLTNSLLGIVR